VHSRIKRHVGAACPQHFIDVDFVIAAGLIRMRRTLDACTRRALRTKRRRRCRLVDASAMRRASRRVADQGRLKIVTRRLPHDDGHARRGDHAVAKLER
jgi:hypothetical protein